MLAYFIIAFRTGSGVFGVRSGARRIRADEALPSFADVAAQPQAVTELRELAQFLVDPERFRKLGARIPSGVLLYGPPGCGKTLLARAVAGESGAAFYSISGSDFVEMYVGVGAARVRELFREARENAPAIVFIDEIDAVARKRRSGVLASEGSSEEQNQALNQLLTEMDGFSSVESTIVIAATNRPDDLDQALLRPGRFDRAISIDRPDEAGRMEILAVHLRDKPVAGEIDTAALARRAIGLTGADLESVTNEAALLAARAGRSDISQVELEAALTRILEAPERQRRLTMRDRTIGQQSLYTERVTFANVAGVGQALTELDRDQGLPHRPRPASRRSEPASRAASCSSDRPAAARRCSRARSPASPTPHSCRSPRRSSRRSSWARGPDACATSSDARGRWRPRSSSSTRSTRSARGASPEGMDTGSASRPSTRSSSSSTASATATGSSSWPPPTGPRSSTRRSCAQAASTARSRSSCPIARAAGTSWQLHVGTKRLAADVDLDALASVTHGLSGADLANVMNEAALLSARRGSAEISMSALEDAVERSTLGISRAHVLSDGRAARRRLPRGRPRDRRARGARGRRAAHDQHHPLGPRRSGGRG